MKRVTINLDIPGRFNAGDENLQAIITQAALFSLGRAIWESQKFYINHDNTYTIVGVNKNNDIPDTFDKNTFIRILSKTKWINFDKENIRVLDYKVEDEIGEIQAEFTITGTDWTFSL